MSSTFIIFVMGSKMAVHLTNLNNSTMKKFLVIAVALMLCTSAAFAQNKGDKYIGGYAGVALQSTSIEGESSAAAAFAIQPEFGYFVADRLKIGASIGYGLESGINILTVAPNLSYYARLCDGLYYTPGVELGLVVGFAQGYTMPGFGVSANLGTLEFRPTEHFGFSANLFSLSVVAMSIDGFTSSAVNVNFGVNPSVGFKYYF